MLNGSALSTQSFSDVGSVGRPLISVIASAATIAPTSKITRITGNVTIATITSPFAYFNGPIYLFNTDSSVGVTDTSGNIALATTLTRYKLFTFIYDPAVSKWYPSATS